MKKMQFLSILLGCFFAVPILAATFTLACPAQPPVGSPWVAPPAGWTWAGGIAPPSNSTVSGPFNRFSLMWNYPPQTASMACQVSGGYGYQYIGSQLHGQCSIGGAVLNQGATGVNCPNSNASQCITKCTY